MVKYKTSNWSIDIEEIEVIRETEKKVTIKYKNWYDKKESERKENKVSSYHIIHNTKIEALEYLLNRAENNKENCKIEIQRYEKEISELNNLISNERSLL